MMRRIGRPTQGRSRSVRVYRLWMREEAVPQEGQEAVRDVVRRVRVISSATSTPSTWTLGRSGKMIIGYLWILEKPCKSEKMFNLSVYHMGDQQSCVRFNYWFKRSSGNQCVPPTGAYAHQRPQAHAIVTALTPSSVPTKMCPWDSDGVAKCGTAKPSESFARTRPVSISRA